MCCRHTGLLLVPQNTLLGESSRNNLLTLKNVIVITWSKICYQIIIIEVITKCCLSEKYEHGHGQKYKKNNKKLQQKCSSTSNS